MGRSKPMPSTMMDEVAYAPQPQQQYTQHEEQEEFDMQANLSQIEEKYAQQAIMNQPQEAEQVDTQPLDEQAEPVEQEPKKESLKEINFKKMREEFERVARERDEYKQIALQNLKQQQAYQQQQQPVAPQQPSYDFNTLPDDELMEGRHLKGVYKDLYNVKQEIEQQRKQIAIETAEAKLRAQYPDIDAVVSTENLEILRLQDPDLYQSVMRDTNLYTKAASAYKIIKKFGIYETPTVLQNKNKISANLQKPKSTAVVSPNANASPLHNASTYMGRNGEYDEAYLETLRKEIRASKSYIYNK